MGEQGVLGSPGNQKITYMGLCATIILGKRAPVVVTTLAIDPRMMVGELVTLVFCDPLGSLVSSTPFKSGRSTLATESTDVLCL